MRIKFFIRTSKKGNGNNARIRVKLKEGDSLNIYAATHLTIPIKYWNNKAKANRDKVRDMTEFLERDWYKDKLDELEKYIRQEYNQVNHQPTSEWLNNTVDMFFRPEKYNSEPETLFGFIDKFIEDSKNRINTHSGKKISESTVKKYNTCFNYLKEYAKDKKAIIDFKDIDLNFYNDFIKFLNRKEIIYKDKYTGEEVVKIGLAVNTIGKQIAVLKAFLNQAKEDGLNNHTGFKSRGFSIITEDAEAVYLNEDELNTLFKLDLSNDKRLERIRDLFLVGCWTGCRYSDFSSINPGQITNGFLNIKQEKTGAKVIIPLHSVVKSILEKYNGELPSSPSNQKFNDYIKEVCKLAGMTQQIQKGITRGGHNIVEELPKYKLVSSHTARRSFATNLYKNGFPSISIMKITGHTTEKAFLKYIKVTPEEHAKLLAEHWAKWERS